MRTAARVAASEWAPISKTLSRSPSFGMPRTPFQISAMVVSVSVAVSAASSASTRLAPGLQFEQSPTVDLAAWGQRQFVEHRPDRWGASVRADARAQNRADPRHRGSARPSAPHRRRACSLPVTATAAFRSAGCLRSIDSISPVSILNPRNLNCWSSRPRCSIWPSGDQRTSSPVR